MARIRKVEVFRRKGSPFWYIRYWEPTSGGGWKAQWKSTKSKRKADAEKLRREIERDLDDGKHPDADIPWCDFAEDFLTKHADAKAKRTAQSYRECLTTFAKTAKPRCLGDVTTGMLEDFRNARLAGGAAPATANRDLRHVRTALRWAYRREYLNRVPDFTGLMVRLDDKQPAIIPEEDFRAIVAALRNPELVLRRATAGWWRVFLYVANYLGMRRGEIFGLTWDRIRFDANEVVVSAGSSKSRRDRVLPMTDELARVLSQWRSSQPTLPMSGEVLPWTYASYRPMYDDWHAILDAAGMPEDEHYTPHDCRSTCASELIAANVPTAVVKDFLGHSTVTTTERYYLNTTPALRAAANARKVALA